MGERVQNFLSQFNPVLTQIKSQLFYQNFLIKKYKLTRRFKIIKETAFTHFVYDRFFEHNGEKNRLGHTNRP